MRTTWWLDDVKVVDNVGFIKDCVLYDGTIGNSLKRIAAEVYKGTEDRNDILMKAYVYDFVAGGRVVRDFFFRISPPYDTTPHMSPPPITNDDIH